MEDNGRYDEDGKGHPTYEMLLAVSCLRDRPKCLSLKPMVGMESRPEVTVNAGNKMSRAT
jgi:hypothetical protein